MNGHSRELCVLVPIYNAAESLRRCLDSLIVALPSPARLLLADDASPDPEVAAICRAAVERLPERAQHIRRGHNLGFVGNVNQAMQQCAAADAVLLNSDTVVSPGWLENLVACGNSDPRIATITPWSNNAEICSFPDFCRANPMPSGEELIALGRAANGLKHETPIDLPTGVGFAMWVRREAWDQLGGFDQATFGKGYGEENDFCFRAAGHGWRNVLCPSAYVAHQGHASFGDTGHRPGGENLARLCARYPDYNARIASFIDADPIRPLREKFSAALRAR